MTILLTGAAGFIGMHVADMLLARADYELWMLTAKPAVPEVDSGGAALERTTAV